MSAEGFNGKQLIPFGKYRGQPLEVLEGDQQYLNWLTNQDWFRQGHPKLYSIVINNFAEPCDTPEHNQMQAMFLDKSPGGFLVEFITLCMKKLNLQDWVPTELQNLLFESHGSDVVLEITITEKESKYRACSKCGGTWLFKRSKESEPECRSCNYRGYSYYCDVSSNPDRDQLRLKIEIKPSVGDDFPSVMRQMKKVGSNILFVRNYSGSGVSEEIFVEMFESQKIIVIFEREILI